MSSKNTASMRWHRQILDRHAQYHPSACPSDQLIDRRPPCEPNKRNESDEPPPHFVLHHPRTIKPGTPTTHPISSHLIPLHLTASPAHTSPSLDSDSDSGSDSDYDRYNCYNCYNSDSSSSVHPPLSMADTSTAAADSPSPPGHLQQQQPQPDPSSAAASDCASATNTTATGSGEGACAKTTAAGTCRSWRRLGLGL